MIIGSRIPSSTGDLEIFAIAVSRQKRIYRFYRFSR
jgi:hypothetical protein